MRRMRAVVSLAVAIGVAVAGAAGAAGSPPAGTAAEVHALVVASARITRVAPGVAAQLADPAALTTRFAFPAAGLGCYPPTPCAFGDRSSARLIVLFGDSHALMWLPALDRLATARSLRVDVFWAPTCPLVVLAGLAYLDGGPRANCPAYRRAAIAAIRRLSPMLVVLAERTYQVVREPGAVPFTKSAWAAALEATIRAVGSPSTKVALLEDVEAFRANPLQCLAAYPSDVQAHCSHANPSPEMPGEQAAEQLAAARTATLFVQTVPWFCDRRCSPIVGDYVVHYDQGHVAVPYAEYLSGVLDHALKPLL